MFTAMLTRRFLRASVAASWTAVLLGLSACAAAQEYPGQYYPPQVPQYQQYPVYAPPVTPTVAQPAVTLAPQEIDQLTAPIALYPDPLLAQLLPAATFPQDLVNAQAWIQAYPTVTEDAIQAQPWDPAIKAMVHYPGVLQMMAQNINWTQALGAAFLSQQPDVLNSIQRLRAQAVANGVLRNSPQQQIVNDNGQILIEPVDPNVLYVPQYDPAIVYNQNPPVVYGQPVISFEIGIPIGLWLDSDFDWGHRWIAVGHGWYHDWRHPSAWDRSPPEYERHRDEWNRQHAEQPHTWQRTSQHGAPRLTSDVIHRAQQERPNVAAHVATGTPAPDTKHNRLPPPLPVGPRPPTPIVEPSRNALGGYESRTDANQAAQRGWGSQQPAKQPTAPAPQPVAPPTPHTPHSVAPTPVPHDQTPRSGTPTPTPHAAVPAPTPPAAPAPHGSAPAQNPQQHWNEARTAPQHVETPTPHAEPAHAAPAPAAPPAPSHAGDAKPSFPAPGNTQDTQAASDRGHASGRH